MGANMELTGIDQAESIIAAVAAAHGCTPSEIKSAQRTATIVAARHIAIFIVRRDTGLSWLAIGAIFSKDHSTCIEAYQKVSTQLHHPTPLSVADRVALVEAEMQRQRGHVGNQST